MNIPKTNRPKWATHFMYQFRQRGFEGYWVGSKDLLLQSVDTDGNSDREAETVSSPRRMAEYLAGEYSLTVKRLPSIILENK